MALYSTVDLGDSFLIRDGSFPAQLITTIVSSFDPSSARLMKGAVTLYTAREDPNITYDDLMEIGLNKTGDILMFLSTAPADRANYYTICTGCTGGSDEDKLKSIAKHRLEAGVIFYTYLLHGSLQQMHGNDPQIPKFALSAAGTTVEALNIREIATSEEFFKMKFSLTSDALMRSVNLMPDSLKSRLKLSFAGNRMFQIARMTRTVVSEASKTDPIMRHLFDEFVCQDAPYVSFHPDNPNNPLRDHSKWLYATLGSLLDTNRISIDDLKTRNPMLFRKEIMEALKRKVEDTNQQSPVLVDFQYAASPRFSVPRIINP